MKFPKSAIKYHCQQRNIETESIYNLLNSATEIDEVGVIEQILFTFPLCGRTIYKDISQTYTPTSQSDVCPLSSVWGPCIGQFIGDGSVSIDEFREIVKSLRSEVSAAATDGNSHILLPLTGGLDSRFIAGCLPNSGNVDSFTFHSGPSTEVLVARRIAGLHGISHEAISLNPSIYTNADLFHKHLGLLQHYHAALITIARSFTIKHPEQRLLLPHGFMGDPVFGSKASYPKKLSRDEACEAYLNNALNRYPFFGRYISKSTQNEILEDLARDYIYYGAKDSNVSFDEILFVTRRQQMIYKIVDLVDDIVPVLTPFASSHMLINSALRLPQEYRISRNAFSIYLSSLSPISAKINSENPWALSDSVATFIRRVVNFSQYILEYFNPEIRISPFQHEQLRASVYSNLSYVSEKIKIFEDLLQINTSWKKSLSRRFNSTDFAYSCSSIGHAFSLIKRKGA